MTDGQVTTNNTDWWNLGSWYASTEVFFVGKEIHFDGIFQPLDTSIVLPPIIDSSKVMPFGTRVKIYILSCDALFSHYGINQEFEQAYFQNVGWWRFPKLLGEKFYKST